MSLNNNKLIDTMRLFNLKNVIDKPTRVTDHSRTLLDPIIVSDTIDYVFSDVFKLPDNISDHDASVVILQCSKNISRSFKREIWQYQKINYEKFEEKLNEINWNEKLDNLNDVDEMCEKFTNCFLKITKECIPTKLITIRNNDRPWFNNEIRKEIRIRDRLRKNVLKLHRERDIKLYKKQRNKVNNMNKIAKENFENNLDYILLENSFNPKTYWKIMKILIKSNKGSNCIPPLKNSINDENLDDIVYGDEDKCNLLNRYFSLISKLEEENVPLPDFDMKTNNVISEVFVTISEIVDI
jgi:hypothetical protein